MTTGHAASLRMVLVAVTLALGVGFCLLADNGTAPARAAQKKDTPVVVSHDPACDYLKGFEPTVEKAGKISSGITACRRCHTGSDVGEAKGYLAPPFKSDEFIRLNEATTWDREDIHAAAMKCLTDPLGKQMEDILKKHRPEGYTVAKAPECLTCHSVDIAPKVPLSEKKYESFATFPGGVTCTLCHGLHINWQNEHFAEPMQAGQPLPWREKPPTYKYAAGMNDLRNPVVKAKLCASCHVGNHEEGKVVTHEMYAAGHPPLPPFELASYMQAEPRHWGYATELKYFTTVKEQDAWKLFHFHPASKEAYLTRHYAVGAIQGLRSEAELLLAEAERATKTGEALDFARFDCYSCHHDLKFPGERQKRGYDGPPGRPPLRAAAGVPAGVVAKHAEEIKTGGLNAKATGFDARWLALKRAATAKPFGDPAKLKEDAKAMKEWCDAFLKVQSETEAPIYTPEEAKRLRAMVTETATGLTSTADPEAAMCLTWGAHTLAQDVKYPLDESKMKELNAILPPNVRMPPFSVMKGKDTFPAQAKYPERMKKIADFSAPRFVDAFNGAFNKK